MNPRLLLSALLILFATYVCGQRNITMPRNEIIATHAFTVVDSLTGAMLSGASVQIVYRGDTIRGITKTISGLFSHSAFEYDKRFKDDIHVTVSFVGYKTLSTTLKRDEILKDMTIALAEDVKQIRQIVVHGNRVAMIMRGDTTIYNATVFKTMEGDFLKSLFEQLPGVTLESNGVYVNGEKIDRIYVDGQRFFGDDTQVPLENMRAADVKNVMVYEEDNAEDVRLQKHDKRKDKVMDITTKSRPKVIRNIMLTLEGGTGTQRNTRKDLPVRHMERFIVNTFSPIQSTGVMFVNFQNRMTNNYSTMQPISPSSGGQGILNYSFRQADSTNIATNIDFAYGKIQEQQNARRVYFPSGTYTDREYLSYSDLTNKTYNINQRNSLHLARRRHIVDAKLSFGYEGAQNDGRAGSESMTDGQQIVATRQNYANEMRIFNFDASYGHKYSLSTGRYIQWRAEGQYRKNRDDGWQIDTTATVGFQTNLDNYARGHNLSYGLSALYNEPAGQHASLVFSYGLHNIDRKSRRTSTDFLLDPMGALDSLNSYDFTVRSNYHALSAGYSYADNKLSFSVYTKGLANRIVRDESFPDAYRLPRTFYHFAPSAKLVYDLSKSKTISISYDTKPQEIALEELRGELNTQNPLYITAGNPNLKPTILHDIAVAYRLFKVETYNSLNFIFEASFAKNYKAYYTRYFDNTTSLPEYNYTATAGTTLSSIKNVDGKYDLTGCIEYSVYFDKLKSTFKTTLSYDYSNVPIFQGDDLNDMKRHQIDLKLIYLSGFSSKINLSVESITSGGYADMTNRTTKYLQEQLSGQLKFMIRKYSLVGVCLYQYYHNPDLTDANQNAIYCNMEAGRKFLEKNQMEVTIGVADLFNQSRNRTTLIQNDYIQTTSRMVLGRCAYVALTYTF